LQETDQHESAELSDCNFENLLDDESQNNKRLSKKFENINLGQKRVEVKNDRNSIEQNYQSTAEEEQCLPVIALNTFNQNWKIKVKLTKKYPVRNYQNQKGSGKILNIDLVDKEGTEI